MRAEHGAMGGEFGSAERFFFSIRYRGRLMEDREGVRLPPKADLEACARYLAQRLREDGSIADLPLDGCAVEVSDETGVLRTTVFLPAD